MLKELLFCCFALGLSPEEFVVSVTNEIYAHFEGSPLLDKPIGQFPESSSWSIVDPEMKLTDYYARMGTADSYPVGDRFYYIDYSGKPLSSEAIDFERMEVALGFARAHKPEQMLYKDVQDFKDKAHPDMDSAIEAALGSEMELTEHQVQMMVRSIKEALTPKSESHDEL